MSDSKYCYPGTDVLINFFDIRDRKTLEEVERQLTSANMALLIVSPVKGNFNLKHLQDIHLALFHELYPFAGKIRDVAIAKSNLFCLPQYIEPMAQEIFGKLKAENYLRKLDQDTFVDRLAYYSGEINALHPFREGNGRTQRFFLLELSKAAGYKILFTRMDKEKLLHADIEAMNGRYGPLKDLYRESIEPLESKSSVLEQITADRDTRKNEKDTAEQKRNRIKKAPER